MGSQPCDHDGHCSGRLRLRGRTLIRQLVCDECGAETDAAVVGPYAVWPRFEHNRAEAARLEVA